MNFAVLFMLSQIVELHIAPGTGAGLWNTQETMVELSIGDTLRIVNDDTEVHAVHTNDGIPCEHGEDMAPLGGTWDCVIGAAYDATAEGPLYDHYHQLPALWIRAQ